MGRTEYVVVLSGDRHWNDPAFIRSILTSTEVPPGHQPVLITGGQVSERRGLDGNLQRYGADYEAEVEARKLGWWIRTYPVDWNEARRTLGPKWKAAGPLRNQLILDDEEPDVVHLVHDHLYTGSKGTLDMGKRSTHDQIATYWHRHGHEPIILVSEDFAGR